MPNIDITLHFNAQATPCNMTLTVPDDYDSGETLMLAATQCVSMRPYYDPDQLFVDSDPAAGIDHGECVRVILLAAFAKTKAVEITVEEEQP